MSEPAMLPACPRCGRVVRLISRDFQCCAWCWKAMGATWPEARPARGTFLWNPDTGRYEGVAEIIARMVASGAKDVRPEIQG